MKTIFIFLTSVFLMITVKIAAQEYVASPVKLSKEAIGKISSVLSENAVIILNDQNDEFAFAIRLFPILTALNEGDSIARLNQSLVMDYQAGFPIDDLDFYMPGNKSKQHSMDGNLTINNITKPVKINFYLYESVPQDISSKDVHTYPLRISFALEINPAEYELDIETAKFTEKIIVVVKNGIINRASNNLQ